MGRLQQGYTNGKNSLRWVCVPLNELVEKNHEPSKVLQVPSLICYKRVKSYGGVFYLFIFLFLCSNTLISKREKKELQRGSVCWGTFLLCKGGFRHTKMKLSVLRSGLEFA